MHFLPRTVQALFAACLFLALPVLAASKTATSRALQPITLTIPGESRPVALYGESHALVIGAADYNNGWPKLSGVRGDVDAVVQALEKQGFKITRVLNPTGDRLYKSIKRFIGQYGQKPDSRLLIYYAGHGYTLKPDADRQLGYLVPVDAPLAERDPGGFIETALSMESMEGYAKQIRAKHALFVFDACFSGSFFKMRAAPEVIALKTTLPVRQFITSGGADQLVPDVSVFRKEFVAALDGEADLNGDGYILGSELGAYLEDKVTNYSRQTQIPQYGKIQDRNLDKGDFVFVLNRPDPQPDTHPEIPERMEPAAPRAGGMSLDAIRKQQELRDGWAKWQTRMRTDYQQVKSMNVAPELKATAWEQFLAAYPQTNPYSDEAESLRGLARAGLIDARQQMVRLADGGERAKPAKKGAKATDENTSGTFKDCAECPEMVVIPAGGFTMGSSDGRHWDEKPPHSVQVARFALGRTEVTQGQWRTIMGNNPSHFSGCGDDCPVEQVKWDDAQAYLKKLSEQTGQVYRLPTEAEWEYAARAGTTTKYPWGDEVGRNNANCSGCGSQWDHKTPAPVASFRANAFGLFDMSGNVWEWVEDCYHDSYAGAPDDGSAWTGGSCHSRVYRGGAWYGNPSEARAAYRGRLDRDFRLNDLGFRAARTLNP